MCPHTKTQNSPRRVVPAALLKAGTLVAVAFLIAGVLGGNQVAWAQGQPIVFSAVGDVPYSDSEKSEFQEHMDSHDLYSASEFLVHLGDIKSGGSSCAESWYRDMATSLKTLSVPAFIIPGDNEWNDCSNPSQAWAFWTTHLLAIERTFCGLPLVERQAVRPENFAFVKNGVLFIGINKVSGGLGGGETSTRLQQNADWVTGQLQTKGSSVRALVIFAQASPSGSPFESAFRAAASAFAKPVLYIHGDGHSWTYNEGYLEPNITRVQVDRGSISHPPVHVTVTMDPANAFLFDRNPWPSGTSPLNRPPCVEAGPDTQRPAGTTVVQLNGKVSDDGEPIPSNVTVNWTYVSGPGGVVTFGNPHAASTTAQFGFDGSYTLQLTATDGALTTSDTVVVDIGVAPNGPPSVTITTPANGSAFDESQTVTFTGSAADDSDGDLTASLSWTSSLDGVIGSGATISTSALSLGVHSITASVTDSGGRTGSQALTITITSVGTPTNPPPSPTVEVRVASGTDDAEESATGSVSLTSSDLELVADGSNQTVGMRFNGVAVEKGATINNAWIQFQADQTSSVATLVMIRGQAADNATTFTTTAVNLSSRPKTTAAVSWSPVPWNTVGAAGADQRTPNLSSVIQEIINRAGWSSGNSLAILITGTGQRVAESFNGVPGAAPLLHIESVSGVPSPDIDVVPNPYGFGSVDIGGTASGTIAIKNVGGADLRVNSISLVDSQAGGFAITQGGAAPFVLAPSATHDLTVQFSPTSGGLKTATLQVTSDDQDESTVNVTVSGSGSAPPDIDLGSTSHDYGAVPVGSNVSSTFVVTNSGGSNLQVSATGLVGTDAGQFTITSGGGSFTLAPGATRNLTVRFAPTSGGLKTATLRLSNNDPNENPFDVTLSGTGTTAPDIAVTPLSHDFGSQALNTSSTRSFAVSNTGNVNLVVSAPTLGGSAAFAFVSPSAGFTVAPGGSNPIEVRFTPTTEGPQSATLTIPSNDPNENPVSISLTGNGVVASATPPRFEEVQQGGSASSTSVTTATSLLGVNGHLYLAAVSTKSHRAAITMTGLGLSWTRVASQCGARNQTGIDLWWAQGAATAGTVTATFSAAPSNAVIVVARYSGIAVANPVAALVAGNTLGVNGACSGGTDSSAYSFNVATTQSNALVFGVVAMRFKAHTPGAGYIERVEVSQGTDSGTAVRIAIVDRAVPTPLPLLLNGSLSSTTDWAVIGVVLRP